MLAECTGMTGAEAAQMTAGTLNWKYCVHQLCRDNRGGADGNENAEWKVLYASAVLN